MGCGQTYPGGAKGLQVFGKLWGDQGDPAARVLGLNRRVERVGEAQHTCLELVGRRAVLHAKMLEDRFFLRTCRDDRCEP